jgi:two-component system KDP operon response regulator KdpE
MTAEHEDKLLPRILVVDDEKAIQRFLKNALGAAEFAVHFAGTGKEALAAAVAIRPDLIILDLGLPDMDGVEVVRRLREWTKVPVIILSVRDREDDKITALDSGADDYITKPFGLRELLARIHAVLRRADYQAARKVPDEIKIGKSLVCFSKGRVVRGRKEVTLGYYESEILKTLYEKQGQVVERKDILSDIWGLDNEPMNRSVDNHVVSLRRKIEEDPGEPRHLLTVHGFGYKLVI